MEDRELLELAAKAAGIEGAWCKRLTGSGIAIAQLSAPVWNPLADDGDALRLAVKLGISVIQRIYAGEVYASAMSSDGEHKIEAGETRKNTSDDFTTTRRAIVRAAASIGKAMEG